jgi:very-short-patch-repair endonuclease
MLSSNARQLRRILTEAERRLWSILRNRQLGGHKFRRQVPFDRYVLDFACMGCKLAVEADGGQHAQSPRDNTRTALLQAHGWRVLRFWNNDILRNTEGVAEAILAAANTPLPQAGEGGAQRRVREPETRCSLAPSPSHADAWAPPSPARGRGIYQRVQFALAQHGLLARGGVGNIVLVGTAGSAFWPHFTAARRDEPDPLDAWARRVLTDIANRFGAQLEMPCDGPPFLPFQRWAMAAEPVFASPMGVLVHPVYGLWHAYRGALVFAESLDLPPREDAGNPCDSCRDRPCTTACPVNAAVPTDVARCWDHLKGGGPCRAIGCHARHACPIGQGYAYTLEHAGFHMEAFISAEW